MIVVCAAESDLSTGDWLNPRISEPERVTTHPQLRCRTEANPSQVGRLPQPSRCWRTRISRPINQYANSSWVFAAALTARRSP